MAERGGGETGGPLTPEERKRSQRILKRAFLDNTYFIESTKEGAARRVRFMEYLADQTAANLGQSKRPVVTTIITPRALRQPTILIESPFATEAPRTPLVYKVAKTLLTVYKRLNGKHR